MKRDRVALDLPYYDGLLAGHHLKEPGHWSHRPAGTDDWLLVATLSGQGRFGSSKGNLAASPGSLTLIAPRTPHDYGTARGAEGWEILWVHFQPPADWLEMLHWPPSAQGIAVFEPAPDAFEEIENCFREVCRLSFSPLRRRRQLSMNALERLLLLCEGQLPRTSHPMDDRVQVVVEYVHDHLRAQLSLEALSSLVCLSPSRFSHLFRSETGWPPLQYVSIQRMTLARTLLERTTLSIAEIATEVGMEPFHFSSRFKAFMGSSPRDYRDSLGRS